MVLGECHALSSFSPVSSNNLTGLPCLALINQYLSHSWHWNYLLRQHGYYKMEGEGKACWVIEHNVCHTVQSLSFKGRSGKREKKKNKLD